MFINKSLSIPQWFEERQVRIEALETCLRRLCGACEALASERRELAARAHDTGRACAALSGGEPHAPLSRALSHLADLHERVSAVEREGELPARAHDTLSRPLGTWASRPSFTLNFHVALLGPMVLWSP